MKLSISRITTVFLSFILFLASATPTFANEGNLQPKIVKESKNKALLGETDVLSYIGANKSKFGFANPNFDLTILNKNVDKSGKTHYKMQQTINGVPVYGKYLQVHLDKLKHVKKIINHTDPTLNQHGINVTPSITND